MIDSPPEYQLTCTCGIKISGTNENGLISLMKRHRESGKFHTAWMLVYGIGQDEKSDLDNMLIEATSMKKGL